MVVHVFVNQSLNVTDNAPLISQPWSDHTNHYRLSALPLEKPQAITDQGKALYHRRYSIRECC